MAQNTIVLALEWAELGELSSGLRGWVGALLGLIALWLVLLVLRSLGRRAIDRLIARARALTPLSTAVPFAGATADRLARRGARVETLRSVLRSALGAGLLIVGILGSGAIVGIDLAPLLAGAGLIGVAVAFGAQSLVRDVLSGLFLLAEDQLGVGDHVDVGVGVSGVITHVGLRTSSLRAENGTLWHLRNGELLRIGNITQGWEIVELRISGTSRSSARIEDLIEQVVLAHQSGTASGAPSFERARDLGLHAHEATTSTWNVRVAHRGNARHERDQLIRAVLERAKSERIALAISAT